MRPKRGLKKKRKPSRRLRRTRRQIRRRVLARRRARRFPLPVHMRRPLGRVAPAAKEAPVVEKPAPLPPPKLSAKRLLLCPGPVNLSAHVRGALSAPEMCHREPEFTDLLQTIRAKLVHALGLDQRTTACLFSGSGTVALEAAVLACAEGATKKLLVFNNGVYGSRIAQIARIHQIPLVEVRSPLAEPPDLTRVNAALKRDSQIGTVAMVHHETSTGMLNPVEEAGALARKFHRRFLVDGISSLGAEKLDLAKNHIGLCVGSSGKCLHGAPGISFVLMSQEEAARTAKLKPRSLVLDLGLHWKAQEAGDPPFTPSVPLFSAFAVALDELAREGLRNRINRYRERAVLLRTGFKKLGFKFLLEEKFLSNALTALWLPKEKSYAQIHDGLKKTGFIVYAGQSELKGKILRVAHMGQLLQSDLKEFLKALKGILAA